MKYKIVGGKKLTGQIKISGNKNSIFPCMAAALLTDEEVILENVSNLSDTESLIQILKNLEVGVKKEQSKLIILAKGFHKSSLPKELMGKLRGSIVLVGAILARIKRVHFYHPGGDVIGQRSIDTHLEGFKALGANLKKEDLKLTLQYSDSKVTIGDCTIFLSEASVTATENLILASSLRKGTVVLKNCPKEPHIQDLCRMLNQMGSKILGIGTDTLEIHGVNKLRGTKFRIGADYIEIGTYAVAAAVTYGRVTIAGIDDTDLDPILMPLKRFGIQIKLGKDKMTVWAEKLKSVPRLTTNIWPGFPTDLMSAAIVLATQSNGVTLCHDWMYESRMFFVDKLISMGAQIILADPHRSLVYGPTKLHGRNLATPDIRAGMALVLASLSARGKSIINQAELIERGYDDVVGKLKNLGAQIEAIKV